MVDEPIGRMDFCRGVLAGGIGACWWLAGGVADAGVDASPRSFDDMKPAEAASLGMDPAGLNIAVRFVDEHCSAGPFPGAALVATRYGHVILERYWGTYASAVRDGLPCNGEVQYPLFSFSKAITATVAAVVHQDGLIDYDAPVSQYIPAFTGAGKEKAIVRHLLTHSVGLPNAPLESVADDASWDKAVADLCAAPLEWAPGSKTQYHPISGVLLMADIIRRVSGRKPWNDICRERLFVPLETDGFTFAPPPESTMVDVVPPPKTFPAPIDKDHAPFLGHPAGGGFGRPRDILKLLNLNLNGGVWKGKVLLKPETLAEMHRVQYQKQIDDARAAGRKPVHEYWGLGWLLRGDVKESWFGFGDVASPKTFGHAGIDTVIGVADPERGVALAFITTASPGEAAATMELRNGVTNRIMSAVKG